MNGKLVGKFVEKVMEKLMVLHFTERSDMPLISIISYETFIKWNLLLILDGQFTAQDLMANKNPPTYITIKCCSQVQMSKLNF